MTTAYLVDGKPMTETEFAQRLRERYMKDDDILDMDYFLHERPLIFSCTFISISIRYFVRRCFFSLIENIDISY